MSSTGWRSGVSHVTVRDEVIVGIGRRDGGSHILEWQVTVPHWPMVGWRYTVMAMSPTTEG